MSESQHAAPLWRLLQTSAQALAGVMAGRSLTPLLEAVPMALRPGTQALAFAALRSWGRARALRALLVRRPPDAASDALLCTALALLVPEGELAYAEFTLVDQAVEAAKRTPTLRRKAPLINACLRRFLREREALLAQLQDDPVARWNHPAWWVARLRQDYPAQWQAILQADQARAPMDLRVNLRRGTVADYVEKLVSVGIAAQLLSGTALRLERPCPVHALPGFAEGLVSVQSATAQQAASLLLAGVRNAAPRILDACAAPGGKTAHLLELCPQAQVLALEVDAARSTRITENLQRLGLQACIQVADAVATAQWWDGIPFDAILLDAPCSASGITRRHPDVRWLRRAGDIDRLAATQDALLAALWPLLAPGGTLLYCTCSVFRQEGAERLHLFLDRYADATPLPAPGHLLPGIGGLSATVRDNPDRDGDGFFFALLQKKSHV